MPLTLANKKPFWLKSILGLTVLWLVLLAFLPAAQADVEEPEQVGISLSEQWNNCRADAATPVTRCIDNFVSGIFEPAANQIAAIIFKSITIGDADLLLIVAWLIAGAVFFTCYFGFINIKGFKHAIELVSGKADKFKKDDNKKDGEVSHFQALATAVSGTVGLGNIVGVSVALSLGGPGAAFWMILAGFLGMSSKFVECILGVKYRVVHADGRVSGGPM
jgi:AGCS family alanine or glycine:cation symporter